MRCTADRRCGADIRIGWRVGVSDCGVGSRVQRDTRLGRGEGCDRYVHLCRGDGFGRTLRAVGGRQGDGPRLVGDGRYGKDVAFGISLGTSVQIPLDLIRIGEARCCVLSREGVDGDARRSADAGRGCGSSRHFHGQRGRCFRSLRHYSISPACPARCIDRHGITASGDGPPRDCDIGRTGGEGDLARRI